MTELIMNDDASVNGSVTEPAPPAPQKPLSGGDDRVGYGKPPKEYKFRKTKLSTEANSGISPGDKAAMWLAGAYRTPIVTSSASGAP